MSSVLPHRFSESAFRKYEKIIAKIVNTYPNSVFINPKDMQLSPETIRGRLRDAITSYQEHNWESKVIPRDVFLTIGGGNGISVSIKPDGRVVAGSKESIKSDGESMIDVVQEQEIVDILPIEDDKQVALLAHLAHYNAFSKRIRVSPTKEVREYLSQNYDIVLTPTNDPNIYLLS